nr:hypothetical protein [Tanacetum cinerariifolium]
MLPTECYSSLVGYNTNGATLTNLSIYGPGCLSRFYMLASMLSSSGLICSGGDSDGESGLDLLQDKGGNSDESGGYRSSQKKKIWDKVWSWCCDNPGLHVGGLRRRYEKMVCAPGTYVGEKDMKNKVMVIVCFLDSLEKQTKTKVMDDESNQGSMIAKMDEDDVVVLIDEKEEDKKVEEAKVVESAQVHGRQAES